MGVKVGFAFFILFIIACLAGLLPPPLSAAENESSPSQIENQSQIDASGDEKQLQQLLNILDKHTEIATKSKLNADYVPGMVTVIDADVARSQGKHTVWEALNLVPGIETSIVGWGQKDIVARGLGRSGVTGFQFQLNGILMNTGHLWNAMMMPYMPLVQVERIEVIVGPGSAVHGEYAFAGVINVITKKEENQICAGVASFGTYGGTAMMSVQRPEKEMSLSLNVAATNTDGADIDSGEDLLYNIGQADVSNAPGRTNERREFFSALVDFAFKDFSIHAYAVDSGAGDYFGFVSALPPPDDEIKLSFRNWGAEARQKITFTSNMQSELKLGYLKHEYSTNQIYVYPPGFAGVYPDGFISSPRYAESRIDGSAGFTWKGFEKQNWQVIWSIARTQMEELWHDINFIPSTKAPIDSIQRFAGDENWMEEDRQRIRNSIMLQDEIDFTPAVTVTAGVHWYHYSDVGSDWSPRLAAVWRATDTHIFKTQYARAFRPPSFVQLYAKNNPIQNGNQDLKSETSDNFELGYVYRTSRQTGRITLFHTSLRNLIIPGRDEPTYINTDQTSTLIGGELSWEQRLGSQFKWDATLSYVDTNDVDIGTTNSIANWLGNIGLWYEPASDLIFNVHGRYVGDRIRDPLDSREDLKAYFTADLTGSIRNLVISGLTLRGGLKNIFDAEVCDPAMTIPDGAGGVMATYSDDFPRAGRTWWLGLSYDI